MYYSEIAKRVRFHKQEDSGVVVRAKGWIILFAKLARTTSFLTLTLKLEKLVLRGKMCVEYGNNTVMKEQPKQKKLVSLKEKKLVWRKVKKEMAANFLKDGTLSVQKIAEISGFSLEQLQKMADEISR